MRHREETPTLAAQRRFASNSRNRTSPPAAPNADLIVDSMLGRHCAGMRGRIEGNALRQALLAPPAGGGASETIRWLFGSLWIQDLHKLAWRCGVPIVRLAEHARASGTTNRNIIFWLNQFAVP